LHVATFFVCLVFLNISYHFFVDTPRRAASSWNFPTEKAQALRPALSAAQTAEQPEMDLAFQPKGDPFKA
jgi:hypothetical protein